MEILIALLLLSIGLLGAYKVHVESNKYQQNSYYRSIAVVRASSMLERLRVSDDPTYRKEAYQKWNKLNSKVLPKGAGSYQCRQTSCSVIVQWERKEQYEVIISSEV